MEILNCKKEKIVNGVDEHSQGVCFIAGLVFIFSLFAFTPILNLQSAGILSGVIYSETFLGVDSLNENKVKR